MASPWEAGFLEELFLWWERPSFCINDPFKPFRQFTAQRRACEDIDVNLWRLVPNAKVTTEQFQGPDLVA